MAGRSPVVNSRPSEPGMEGATRPRIERLRTGDSKFGIRDSRRSTQVVDQEVPNPLLVGRVDVPREAEAQSALSLCAAHRDVRPRVEIAGEEPDDPRHLRPGDLPLHRGLMPRSGANNKIARAERREEVREPLKERSEDRESRRSWGHDEWWTETLGALTNASTSRHHPARWPCSGRGEPGAPGNSEVRSCRRRSR